MTRWGVFACAVLASAAPLTAQVADGSGTIVATGLGEVVLEPDRVSVAVSIRTISAESDEAQTQNEATTEAVFAAIVAMDLDPDSIRLTNLRIRPHREYGPDGQRDAGYAANRSLRVATDDLGIVSRIVAVATEAGATSVDRVTYSSSRIEAARLEALAQAVHKARRDAEVMAAAAGGRLGRLTHLTTNPATYTPMQVRGARTVRGFGTGQSTPDAADLTIDVFVEGQWVFQPED